MFGRIVVAVDGTLTSNRGLATATGLAKDQGATLHIVHVVDELVMVPMVEGAGMLGDDYIATVVESLRESGRKILSSAEKAAAKGGATVDTELLSSRGQPVASVILAYAKRVRADLIVLGTHGRRGLRRAVMGSDAEGVLREATVPVLLVRTPERAHARKRAARARPAAAVSRKKPSKAPAAR